MPEKCISEAFQFCVGSLLQCFRGRIRAQIFRSDLVTVRPPPIHLLVAHLLNNTSLLTSYVSFPIAKAFWTFSEKNSFILKTNHWYRIQTLMLFSQLQFYPIFSLSRVWNSAIFPIMFYKLRTCSDNTKSADFRVKCLPVASSFHFVRLYLIKNVFWSSIFKFVFRHSLLQKNKEGFSTKSYKNMGNCNINRQAYN